MTLHEVAQTLADRRPIPPGDVVCAHFERPLRARYYPLGFPLELETNCPEILEAMTESWGTFHQLFDTPPVQLRVGVLDGGNEECPPVPLCRVQQDIFAFIADQQHYGIADMNTGMSSVWLTRNSLRHRRYIRYSFLECAAIVPIVTRFVTGVHSACVARNGAGILLCGDSGAGKSTLSYACAKAGWTYVTDDGSYLVHGYDDLLAVGNCHQIRFRPATAEFFPEIDGQEVQRRSSATKPSIELVPADFHSIRTSQSAQVTHLVLLNRHGDRNESLRRYDKNVVRAFLRQGRFSPAAKLKEHYAMIDRLLEHEVLELCYRDLDWAVAQLNTLAGVRG